MSIELIVALMGFGGGLLGTAIGSWLSHKFSKSRTSDIQARNVSRVAAAIASELEAIVEIEKRRDWRGQAIQHIIGLTEPEPQKELDFMRLDNRANEHGPGELNSIYRLHQADIGILGEHAKRVVVFYVNLAATEAGFSDLGSELFLRNLSVQELIALYEKELESLNSLVSEAQTLAADLRALTG